VLSTLSLHDALPIFVLSGQSADSGAAQYVADADIWHIEPIEAVIRALTQPCARRRNAVCAARRPTIAIAEASGLCVVCKSRAVYVMTSLGWGIVNVQLLVGTRRPGSGRELPRNKGPVRFDQ